MKRAIATILAVAAAATTSVMAQDPPRALPVDPELRPDAAADFFQRGRNLYDSAQNAGDPDNRRALFLRAVEVFSLYLNDFPNHQNAEPAWWYLGNSHYQTGNIEEARRCFNILLTRYGKGPWVAAAAYTLAADYYHNRQFAMAAPLFERYAENASRDEERPRGYFFAGNANRLQGRNREAAASYRKVIADPAGGLFAPQARIALGNIATAAGNDIEALTWFEEVASDAGVASKIRGEAALNAALTATRLDRTELSETYLKLIMTTAGMEDFRPDAQTALMSNQFACGQYAAVVDSFRRSTLKAEGEKEAARLMLAARSLMRLKKPDEATNLFREIERLVPPEHDLAFQASYYRLLCFYQIEGRHVPDQVDTFIELYRRSRPEDTRIHTALMMKAESLHTAGDLEAAARIYSEINPSLVSAANRPGLLYQRGWVLAEAGDQAGAIRSLDEFITSHPDDPRIHSALAKRGKCLAEIGENARAKTDFDRIIAEATDSDLLAFAWLEAARMHRAASDIPAMLAAYRGYLENVQNPGDNTAAEAHYWIGWGLVRSNAASDAVRHLERARELRADAYVKHAGLLLALGYFSSQDATALAAEIDRAIESGYISDLPDQAIQWAGMQMFNDRKYSAAARYLKIISDPAEPRLTAKEIWRYLAKSSIEAGDPETALPAITNVLDVEDNPAWIADGLLDRGRALLALDRPGEARKAAEDALELNPQGRTSAQLRILLGDLEMRDANHTRAAAEFLVVVQFHEDPELKPEALDKLIKALEAQGDNDEAEKYRLQLNREFPNWKAP